MFPKSDPTSSVLQKHINVALSYIPPHHDGTCGIHKPFHLIPDATDAAVFFHPHWPTVLLTGAWRSLVALALLVLDDELRGLLLRSLFARRLQVFLYWCRSSE